MKLKEMLKGLIGNEAPEYIRIQNKIDNINEQKASIQAEIDKLNVLEAEMTERLEAQKAKILEPLTQANIAIVITADYVVERKQNANPTVTVIDESKVPSEWQVLKPRVDKRGIQSHFLKTGNTPAGVSVERSQYLVVTERKEEEKNGTGNS